MTLSVGESFIVAVSCIVVLAAMVGLVLLFGKRPYFRHPKPSQTPTGVSGGVHEGDPRSMMPRRDETVEPADTGEPADEPASSGGPADTVEPTSTAEPAQPPRGHRR